MAAVVIVVASFLAYTCVEIVDDPLNNFSLFFEAGIGSQLEYSLV